jgi:hypothetical protein
MLKLPRFTALTSVFTRWLLPRAEEKTPPSTATLQTQNSELAPAVDYYGSILAFGLLSFLTALLTTGNNFFRALALSLGITLTWFSLRRIRHRYSTQSRQQKAYHAQAVELYRQNIREMLVREGASSGLTEILSPLGYSGISEAVGGTEGLPLFQAWREDHPVLIAFFDPPGDNLVSQKTVDAFLTAAARLSQPDLIFLTTGELSVPALQVLAAPPVGVKVRAIDGELLASLGAGSGSTIYPSRSAILDSLARTGVKPTGGRELSLSQSLAANQRKIKLSLLTAAFLLAWSRLLGNQLGLRTVYQTLTFVNLCLAGWLYYHLNQQVSLANIVLSGDPPPRTEDS